MDNLKAKIDTLVIDPVLKIRVDEILKRVEHEELLYILNAFFDLGRLAGMEEIYQRVDSKLTDKNIKN